MLFYLNKDYIWSIGYIYIYIIIYIYWLKEEHFVYKYLLKLNMGNVIAEDGATSLILRTVKGFVEGFILPKSNKN